MDENVKKATRDFLIGDTAVIIKHKIIGEVGAIFQEKGNPVKYRVDYTNKTGEIKSWWEPAENLGSERAGEQYINK